MTKEYNDAVSSLGAILRETSQHTPLGPEGHQAQNALAAQMEASGNPYERWGWSTDLTPETWSGAFHTRVQAIADARDHGYKAFYVISGSCPDGSDFMPKADTIVDMIGEAASDEAGDSAEDFPAVSAEAEKELDELLKAWSKKHLGVCDFWVASGDAEKVVIEE